MKEVIIVESDDMDEWYGTWYTCESCGTPFMTDSPCYCPGCGCHVKGIKYNNDEIIYNFD